MDEQQTIRETKKISWPHRHVKTPTVIQMEAVECGAAALCIIMRYHGRIVPLEKLRVDCGISRDGSKALNVLKAARNYGLIAKGFRKELEDLKNVALPYIVFWNFNHFLVVEGYNENKVHLNDPACGPRSVSHEEFDQSFTGIVLTFEKGPKFVQGGETPSLVWSLSKRLKGMGSTLVFVILAGLALVIPGLVIPTFSKIFVDEILVSELHGWLRPLLVGIFLTAVVRGLLTWLQQKYLLRLENKLAVSSSSKFFWHVLKLPMEFYAQRFGGEIGYRVAINDKVAQLLSGKLATTVLQVLMVFFYALLMVQYSFALTLTGIIAASLNMLALKFLSSRRKDGNQKLLQEQGKLMSTSMSGLQSIETLKATGGEGDFFSKWAGHHAKVINASQELAIYTQMLEMIPPFLSALNSVIVLSLGGLFVMNGELSMGMLVAFQSLMTSFMTPFNDLVNMGSTLQEAEGDMNRLDDVFQSKPEAFSLELRDDEQLMKLTGQVELKNMTFGYSRLEPPLIENFNLKLKPGSRVALVGGSGSGKSTISRLMSGLYQPWSGEILFDGKRRCEIPRAILNRSLAMVDQDIFLFEGTIRENMTLWDSSYEECDLIRAAKDACIHDEVAARSGAYDSRVEEGGTNFSGGQRQRLEIARALVSNPNILILDEATSALDAVTEKSIDDRLRYRGSTCIIIAHRLSTIRDSDEIIVLEKGRVVERGTHEEMKDKDGSYARLIKAE